MDDGAITPTRHKLTTGDLSRMTEAGIFAGNQRIELIDGDLIDMAPIGQTHAATVNLLAKALILACGDRAIVSVQNSVELDPLNEPQPDFAILRPRADFYARGAKPGPADILLLIEVADSSAQFDRTVKPPLYAQAGIAEYWIVDLQRRVVEAYSLPSGATYASMTKHKSGEQLALRADQAIKITLALMFAT